MTSRETAKRFIDFAVRLKRAFRSGIAGAGALLTEERFRTLHYLEDSGGAGLKELSERILISPSSLCIMLGKLEEEGFVERSREDHDRRAVRYRLTAEGATALGAARERRLQAFSSRFSEMDDRDRERFAAAIAEMEDLIGVLERKDQPR